MTRWTKYLSKSGTLRVVAISAGEVIDEMGIRHALPDDLKKGLGEGSLAGLLIAASHKSGERINLSIQGSGIWKKVVVDAYPEGFVRAFIYGGEKGDWDNSTRGPWGNGIVTVLQTKNAEGQQPYSGMVSLHSGFLDQDMSDYWKQSAQIPTNIAFSSDGKKAIMVQVVTGASPEDVALIESSTPALRKYVETDILKIGPELPKMFNDNAFIVMEDTPIQFRCNCSQQRVEQALLLTGQDDIRYLISNEQSIEMRCDFCNNTYRISRERAEELMKTLSTKGS